MTAVGLGYRRALQGWLATRPPEVGCLEITAEHFYDGGDDVLRGLARDYPLFVHGLGLSLGTPGPLDESVLSRYARVVELAQPRWISEHIAFTRTADLDLGHLNPVPYTRESLAVLVEHVDDVRRRCDRPIILENITSHVRAAGDLTETDFINQLCEQADCGLLLDVTNLYINGHNHGYDPRQWLDEIDPQRIIQLHVVGYALRDGRLHDTHSERIQPELLELVADVLAVSPVEFIMLERDDRFDALQEIREELRRLEEIVDRTSAVES